MNTARRAALGPNVLANPAGLRLLEHRAIPQVPQDRPLHEQPGSFDDAQRHALDGRSQLDAATSSGRASTQAECESDHIDPSSAGRSDRWFRDALIGRLLEH
jgi:hypothetical protein